MRELGSIIVSAFQASKEIIVLMVKICFNFQNSRIGKECIVYNMSNSVYFTNFRKKDLFFSLALKMKWVDPFFFTIIYFYLIGSPSPT